MNIVVVGDILLDVDIAGEAQKLSPDGPVPVVAVAGSTRRPGGAGLVALLLARDGCAVTLVTALADDDGAETLRSLLAEEGGGSLRIVAGHSPSPTVVKTRVRAQEHVVVRLDEGGESATPEVTPAMLDALAGPDAIVVADYGRGLTADEGLRAAIGRAAASDVPVVWDPHPRGSDPVPGVVVTPNLTEALSASGVGSTGVAGAAEASAVLLARWRSAAVVVTLGADGALLHTLETASGGGRSAAPHVVPAAPIPRADPCGAGDRFAATLATALGEGRSLPAAVQSGVLAAGRFLAAGGVAALADTAVPVPVAAGGDALAVVRDVRARGGTVVATGGCFDLLHAGHARTLAAARSLGDCLVVCLNSDTSVRALKGPERPIMTEDDRRDLLLALECVDAVLVFAEDTPVAALRRLMPDIWVKGGDYVAEDLPETAVLAEWGGRTVTVPYHPGRSTTALAGALARVG